MACSNAKVKAFVAIDKRLLSRQFDGWERHGIENQHFYIVVLAVAPA